MSNKPLTLGMVGENVAALHQALAGLGLSIPEAETKRRFFGPATRIAVGKFQKIHGINPSCEVCEKTAALLSSSPTGVAITPGNINPTPTSRIDLGVSQPPSEARLAQPISFAALGALDENLFIVRGTVSNSSGQLLPDIVIRAFDRDLRRMEQLGETQTDAKGAYEIRYTLKQFAQAEIGYANLIVRAFDQKNTQLVESPRIRQEDREAVVNLTVSKPQLSEWNTIQQVVWPLLDGQGAEGQALNPWELTEDDIGFLVEETGLDRENLRLWILAMKTAHTSNLLGDSLIEDLYESIFLYAWFRVGLPQLFPELIRRPTDALIKGLDQAIAQNYISVLPQDFRDNLPAVLDRLRINESLKPAPEGEPASLGDVLATLPLSIGLEPDKQQIVSVSLQGDVNPDLSLVDRLKNAGLNDNQVWAVQRTLGLQTLTQGHLPLMRDLQLDTLDASSASLRDLARYETAEWREIVKKNGVPSAIEGKDDAQKQQNYAELLSATIENLHPSAWIANRIPNNRFPVDDAVKIDTQTFLNQNPQFQIGKTPVLSYFDNPDTVVVEGIPDVEKVKNELLKIERIVNCSPRLEIAGKVLGVGFQSAHAIAQYSRDRFVATMTENNPDITNQAHEVYQRAEQANAKATAVATEYLRAERDTPLAIMKSRSQPTDGLDSKTANLRALFGNLDFCECEHCSSVYSPAAYLVDLMNVLDGGTKTKRKSPLDVLLDRRPDLAQIDLTCDNTNTSLPYIDLALEVLEGMLDGEGSGMTVQSRNDTEPLPQEFLSLVSDTRVGANDNTFSSGVLPEYLRAEINSWGISLTDKAIINPLSDLERKSRWLVRDHGWRIHLEFLSKVLQVVDRNEFRNDYRIRVWPQTYGSSEELKAFPSFVFPLAYLTLSQALYPWTLPFDLWREETKVWLRQLGVERHELMVWFTREDHRYSDFETAIEFLGFSKAEADKLTTEVSGWSVWGFATDAAITTEIKDPIGGDPFTPAAPNNTWVGVLSQRASLIRHRAGLTQRELMNLLETNFIQGAVASPNKIQLIGDECDASKMTLLNLNSDALKRIHLFVRIWHKLDWSMPNLDRAIQSFPQSLNTNNGTLNPALLVFLANVEYLRRYTNLPLGILLNWYTPTLSTQQYADFSGTQPRILPSTYEELFYDRSVARPKDAVFELNSHRTELLPSTPVVTICSKISAVAAALSTKPTELEVLLNCSSSTNINNALTLANLSVLSRYTSLAKVLRLSVRDLLLAIDLTGINPFNATENTLNLLDRLQLLQATGFSLLDLDYLLRHKSLEQSKIVLPTSKFAGMLAEIRQGLQQIQQETTLQIDERGEITSKWLAYLQWPSVLIDELLGPNLLGRGRIETTYDANHLPAGITLPTSIQYDRLTRKLSISGSDKNALIANLESIAQAAHNQTKFVAAIERLKNVIQQIQTGAIQAETIYDGTDFPTGISLPSALQYDETTKKLILVRKITEAELSALKSQTTPPDFNVAIDSIIAQARGALAAVEGICKRMYSYVLPVHTVTVRFAQMPIAIPQNWAGRFYFQPTTPTAGSLVFVGLMTDADKQSLLALVPSSNPTSADYTNAINQLYNDSNIIPASPAFIDQAIADRLVFERQTPQDRFAEVSKHLLPYVRKQLQPKLLMEKIAIAFGLEPAIVTRLLSKLKYPINNQLQPLKETLLATAFATSDAKAILTLDGFKSQFDALELLYKAGVMVSRLGLEASQVDWLFGSTWQDLPDMSQLPLVPISGSGQIVQWVNLAVLSQLRASLPGGSATLEQIADLLNQNPVWDSFQNALAVRLDWPASDFKLLLGSDGLQFTSINDFKQPQRLKQFADCLALIVKLGATVKMAIAWKKSSLTANDALAARQLVRSRYDQATWYQLAQPIQNKLRQQRRTALLDYLIAKEGVRDANDLFGKYLIDPEMGDCMMTTRILQATATVQLFIHRCFMGLEPEVPACSINKDRWQWMKNYRVWEANRKVFFYPENWIEPELRDDKSPFFQELESELLQGDVTSEKAESALRNYLTKLDEVSRLEVVGMYRDTPKESDGTPKYGFETLYVFGRTYTKPHNYFYRSYHKLGFAPTDGYWTSWQSVDLSIEDADLVYPVVWQKKLHLFWLTFSEKADNIIPQKDDPKPPNKYWNVSLNWSAYENSKWQAQKIYPIDLGYSGRRIPTSIIPKSNFVLTGQDNLTAIRYGLIAPAKVGYSFTPVKLTQLDINGYSIDVYPQIVLEYYTKEVTPVIEFNNEISLYLAGVKTVFDSPSLKKRIIYLHQKLGPGFEFRAPSVSRPSLNSSEDRLYSEAAHFILSESQNHSFFGYPYWGIEFKTSGGFSGTGGPFSIMLSEVPRIQFTTFYHPQTQQFQQTLRELGVSGFLKLETQTDTQATNVFSSLMPNETLIPCDTWPNLDVDFLPNGAYSQYNWELFFHLPFIVATHLAKNQRFEEARQWFHYIFDPTNNDTSDPTDDSQCSESKRFWRFRPFHDNACTTPIQQLAQMLADPNNTSAEKRAFDSQVKTWLANPFKPHAIARWRNRSYMFSVVMKYLDNLIAWGDQLFRRDTRESLNEAAQIYILAAQILGRKPESVPRRTRPQTQSFADIRGKLDALGNIQVAAENVLPPSNSPGQTGTMPSMSSLLFCVPENAKILEYYDKVADRLVKLRNCMNIDGVVRQLALFDPPIDPAILVKAAAAGIDLSTALSDLNTPLPLYRFNVISQKATELCAEVKSLGGALLSALEKRDAEAMALLRSRHEINLLQAQRQLKELQVEEAKANIESLIKSLEAAQTRFINYVKLIKSNEDISLPSGSEASQATRLITAALETVGKTTSVVEAIKGVVNPSATATYELLKQAQTKATEALSGELGQQDGDTNKVPMIPTEKRQLEELKQSHDLQQILKAYQAVAQLMAMIPDFTLGTQGAASSPVVQAQAGGTLFSKVVQLESSAIEFSASEYAYKANLHSILASYQRRATEWLHQAKLAQLDIEQIGKQSVAAALRLNIATKDIALHQQQIENAQSVDEFMQSKYTNQVLYNWMVGQISSIYFQSYQLTYDVAKRAEKAYRFELGLQDNDTNFIQFGYWDSLKKGLLAGEKLYHDLKRMEVAYLEQNRREFELTKHISLILLDPLALVTLRETGRCFINLPEEIFDLDYPGHYFRRIKSVSLTLPCVVGPYTTISCTLRLLKNSIRINTKDADKADNYPRHTNEGLPTDDDRFIENNIPVKAIAVSNAQNDSGIFELSFRDERYLPFEGAGAISQWSLELFNDNSPDFGKALRQFDYGTITDAILHIKYMAREDAGPFKNGAVAHLRAYFKDESTPSLLMLNLRQEFPSQWHRFLNPTKPEDGNVFELEMTPSLFPIRDAEKKLKVNTIWLLARCKGAGRYTIVMTPPLPELPPDDSNTLTLDPVNQYGGLYFRQKDVKDMKVEIDPKVSPVTWQLQMSRPNGNLKEEVEDVFLVLGYEWG